VSVSYAASAPRGVGKKHVNVDELRRAGEGLELTRMQAPAFIAVVRGGGVGWRGRHINECCIVLSGATPEISV
jgi:hypothetical protein